MRASWLVTSRPWALHAIASVLVALPGLAQTKEFDLSAVLHHPGVEFVVLAEPPESREKQVVFAVNEATGAIQEFALPPADGWHFIVDGRLLYFTSGKDLWTLDLVTGARQRVAKSPFWIKDLLGIGAEKFLVIGTSPDINGWSIAEIGGGTPRILTSFGGSGWPEYLSLSGNLLSCAWRDDHAPSLGFVQYDLRSGQRVDGAIAVDLGGGIAIDSGGLTFICGAVKRHVPFKTVLTDYASTPGCLFVRTFTDCWVDFNGRTVHLDEEVGSNPSNRDVVLTKTKLALLKKNGEIDLEDSAGIRRRIKVQPH